MRKLGLLLSIVVLIALIFTVSCVNKEVPVTETYYETQYKTEYRMEIYTETVDVVVDRKEGKTYLNPVILWSAGFPVEGVGFNYYGYETSTTQHSKSQVKVTFLADLSEQNLKEGIVAYDLTGGSQIPAPPARQTWGEGAAEAEAWFDNLYSIMKDPKHKLPVLVTHAKQGIDYQTLLTIDRCVQHCWDIFIIDSDPAIRNQYTGELTHVGEAFNFLYSKPANFRVSNSVYARVVGDSWETAYIVFDATGVKAFAILDTWYMLPMSDVQLLWTDEVIEKRTDSKERQVPYEVPYQVEKQRTVMQTKEVPFWEVVLGK